LANTGACARLLGQSPEWDLATTAPPSAAGGERDAAAALHEVPREAVHGRRAVDGERDAPRTPERSTPPALARLSPDIVYRVLLPLLRCRYQVVSSRRGASAVTIWGPRGERLRLRGHPGGVLGVRFFPEGGRMLTWGRDGRVVVGDALTGRAILELPHGILVRRAEILPGGSRVATLTDDGTSVVWHLEQGDTPTVMVGRAPYCRGGEAFSGNLAVFPSGDRLLSWGQDSHVRVMNVTDGAVICSLSEHYARSAAIFPAGDKVATCGADQRTIIWNASSCEMLWELFGHTLVTGVAVLAGGDVVATSGADATVLWSVASGLPLRRLDERLPFAPVQALGVQAFKHGDRLLTHNSAEAIVWNATSGELLLRFVTFPTALESVAVAAGGDLVATCGGGQVGIWDALSGAKLHTFQERPSEPNASPCQVAIGSADAVEEHDAFRVPWREPHVRPQSAASAPQVRPWSDSDVWESFHRKRRRLR